MKKHSEIHIRNYFFKPDVITNILIYSIAFILIFVTDRNSPFISNFSNIVSYTLLTKGFIFPAFFSVFDILIIILSIRIILIFGTSIDYANSKIVLFFVLTLFMIFLTLVNPNNHSSNPIFGLPLFSDMSNYTHLIFLYALIFVRKRVFVNLLSWFFKPITIMIIANIALLYLLYFSGFKKGISIIGGYKSILLAEDILIILVFFQILFLYIYSKSNNKLYLFLSILLIGVQILSFRRAGIFLTLIINALYYMFLYKSTIRKLTLFKYSLVIILLFIIVINFSNILNIMPQNIKIYTFRVIGAFVQMEGANEIRTHVISNRHFEESIFAYQNAITTLKFWGTGYGKVEFDFLYGSSTGIHNAYIAVLYIFGLFALAYYLYILVLVVVELSKILLKKGYKTHNLFQIKIIISIYLIILLLSSWVLIMQNFVGIKMIIFRSLLLVSILKIDNNYIVLLENTLHQNHSKY